MELTVNQIIEKQKQLKQDLADKLNKFEEETGLTVTGKVSYGYTQEKMQHYVSLNYSNPFM